MAKLQNSNYALHTICWGHWLLVPTNDLLHENTYSKYVTNTCTPSLKFDTEIRSKESKNTLCNLRCEICVLIMINDLYELFVSMPFGPFLGVSKPSEFLAKNSTAYSK